MEKMNMTNVYILNNGKSSPDIDNKSILYHYNNKPIIIKTEEGTETAYIPSYENGEFVIKPIATEYVEETCMEIEETNIKQELNSDDEKLDSDNPDESFQPEEYLVEYLDEEFLDNKDSLLLNNHDVDDADGVAVSNSDISTLENENVTYIREQLEHHNALPNNSRFIETSSYPEEPMPNEMFAVFDGSYYGEADTFKDIPIRANILKKASGPSILKQQPIINKRPIILGNQKIRANISIPNAMACRNTLKPNQKYLLDGGLIRIGRKHLVVDTKTMIGPLDFKKQLTDSSDLVQPIQLAPSTKKEIHKKMHGLHYFFANPTSKMPSDVLLQKFQRHCNTRKQPNNEVITDMELLPLGAKQNIDLSKVKRITRRRRYPDAEQYQREKNEKLKELQATALLNNQLRESDNVNIVINSDEILKYYNPNIPTSSSEEQIIVIHDPQENAENNSNIYAQKNIEALLAAAAESSTSSEYQQIFVCDDNIYTQGNVGKVFVSENNQIFLVQDDIGQLFQTNNDIL